jgi:hypothetical protein
MQIRIGHAARPFNNTPPCGDGWLCHQVDGIHRGMLADGIGHGRQAHRIVSLLADHLAWFCRRSTPLINLDDCMVGLHQFLQEQGSDWQAAMALIDVDPHKRCADVIVVGNIQVHHLSVDEGMSVPSLRGMVGGRLPAHLPITHWPISASCLIGMFSDGLTSAPAYAHLKELQDRGVRQRLNIQSEAETMINRFGRLTDDASCALLQVIEVEA